MKYILLILLFPFLVQAQTINAPGQPATITINAPGQPGSVAINPLPSLFSIYQKSDEPFVTAFDYTPDADLTFPSDDIAFSSADVESIPLDLKVDDALFWQAYEKWKITLVVTMGECASGDDGFFFGIKSEFPSNFLYGIGIETIVANKVRMYMYNSNTKFTTNFVDMSSAYTPGASMTLTAERNIDQMTFTTISAAQTISINYTLSMNQDKTVTFNFPNLKQKFQILFKQGIFTVTDYHVESNSGNKDLMFGGNSLSVANGATTTPQTWNQAIKETYPSTTVFAGGGNTSQYILDALPAVVLANPSHFALEIGTNDLNGGISLATLQTNYESIISQLVAEGITPIILLIPPGTNGNIPTFNTWLVDTYAATYRIIDFYSILKDGALSTFDTRYTFDNIHVTQEGQDIQRDAFLTQWKTDVAPIAIKTEVLTATTIKVTFSDKVTATNTGFTFEKNGSPHNPSGIAGSGTNFLTFTVPSTLEGDVITMSYLGGDAEDADGNPLATITDASTINLIDAPTIVSMTVTGIHTVRVVFSEAVTTDGTGWHFNIGVYNTVTGVSGSGTNTVDFTFASTAISGISTYNGGYESIYGNTVDLDGNNPLQSFKNTNLTSGF